MPAPLLTELREQTIVGRAEAVTELAYSRDGSVAVTTLDGWMFRTDRESPIRLRGRPRGLAWTDDGWVATIAEAGLHVAGPEGWDRLIDLPPDPRALVGTGSALVVGCGTTIVGCTDAGAGHPVEVGIGSITCLARVSPSIVAVGGAEGLALVDVWTAMVDARVRTSSVLALACDRSARFVAAGELGGSVQLVTIGRESDGRSLDGYPDRVRLVAFAGDGELLVATADDELTFWTVHPDGTTDEVPDCRIGHEVPITALAVSPCGGYVASGDAVGVVALWSRRELSDPIARVELDGEVLALGWRPDGRELAAGTASGVQATWRVEPGLVA